MTSPRDAHTATLLYNGKVLLAGGIDGMAVAASAELYDPATSRFQLTGALHTPRVFHTAILLTNGKVLIVGGYDGGNYLRSAELFDPLTGLFTPTASMTDARSGHSCTRLTDGTVLIAGGRNSTGILDSAEIYDPAAGIFYAVDGVLKAARTGHTATLRADDLDHRNDRVLIAGGVGIDVDDEDDDGDSGEEITLKSAELYNPTDQQFGETTGAMTTARREHTALLLQKSDQGYLRFQTTQGLLLTEFYSNGGAETAINGINLDKYAGVKKIYAPWFFIAPPGFETRVNVINGNQDSEALVALTARGPDGQVLAGPVVRVLPKNAQMKDNLWDLFDRDPDLFNQTGWLEVTSSVDRIVGIVSFTDSDDSFLASPVLSGVPLSHFLFPLVVEDYYYQTGIALLNSGDLPANVQLELWGPDGTFEASASLTLAPHTQKSETLGSYFPGIQVVNAGNLRIHSDQPLHSEAIMYDRKFRFLAPMPPVPFPE
jgi:hypothetical protein